MYACVCARVVCVCVCGGVEALSAQNRALPHLHLRPVPGVYGGDTSDYFSSLNFAVLPGLRCVRSCFSAEVR